MWITIILAGQPANFCPQVLCVTLCVSQGACGQPGGRSGCPHCVHRFVHSFSPGSPQDGGVRRGSARSGRPQGRGGLPTASRSLSTACPQGCPQIWTPSCGQPPRESFKVFFRRPPQNPRTRTKSLCTGFSTGPFPHVCRDQRRDGGRGPGVRCGQGNRARASPGTRGNGECRGRTPLTVTSSANPAEEGRSPAQACG